MHTKPVVLFIYASALWSSVVVADISRDVRGTDARSESFAEVGVGFGLGRVAIAGFNEGNDEFSEIDEVGAELVLFLSTRLEWEGLFVELFHESFALGTVGYNAWSNDEVEFDLILTSTLGELDPGDVAGFESLNERDAAVEAGVRSIVYSDDNILQFEAIADVSGTHDGFSVSWQFGRNWQVRNWATHALLGLRYFSDDMTDHYFGVSASEASGADVLNAYRADEAIVSSIDLGATRPINENWVFRANATVFRLPDSVLDSPFVTERIAWQLGANAVYVF